MTSITVSVYGVLQLVYSIAVSILKSNKKNLGLPETQQAFRIYDVFRDLKAQSFIYNLHSNNISDNQFPPSKKYLFQPLM